jgi:hypothetical protein
MTRLLLLAAGYVAGAALLFNGHWQGLAVLGLTGGAHALNALVLRSWHRCPWCGGRGRWWLGPNHGDCVFCGGRGRYPRASVRAMRPGKADLMRARNADRRPGRLNPNRRRRR